MTETKRPQKGRIFISYRRADSEGYAGRIYDRLAPHFGDNAIFMDVDDIPAGVDFVKYLENEVQSCDVLIALIGKQWLNVRDEHGMRRLDNPNDFVRIEVSTALKRDIRVIPVLLGGTQMPNVFDLPDDLESLTRRNALLVYHHSFHADTNRLIKHLENALDAVEKERQRIVKEIADRDAAEKAVKEKAEREAVENAAREKAEKLEKEKTKRKPIWSQKLNIGQRIDAKENNLEELLKEATKSTETQTSQQKSGKRVVFWGIGVVAVFVISMLVLRNINKPQAPVLTSTNTSLSQVVIPSTETKTPKPSVMPAKTSTPTKAFTSTPTFSIGSTKVNDLDGMIMVFVPGGEFIMGSNNGDSKPIHNVILDEFWIDKTEVTNQMFSLFIKETSYQTDAEKLGYSTVSYGFIPVNGTYEYSVGTIIGANWQHPTGQDSSNSGMENFPVINVSWNDAFAYCQWAGRRLPTEAEWEKAARGTDARLYPWGEKITNNLGNFANSNDGAVEVGSYFNGVSPYGAFDMAGNVEEWVNDWYQSDYYITLGDYASNPTGPSIGDTKVLRGGSWLSNTPYVSTVQREGLNPVISSNYIGFRCASEITP